MYQHYSSTEEQYQRFRNLYRTDGIDYNVVCKHMYGAVLIKHILILQLINIVFLHCDEGIFLKHDHSNRPCFF